MLVHGDPKTADIWLYSTKTRQLKPYIATPFDEYDPVLSPDGSLLAYVSEESGHPEIYVERFPSRAERRQISANGGSQPMWRADGRELFYRTDTNLMSVDATNDGATPQVLFRDTSESLDAAADGQRFLVARPVDDITTVPLTFVSDWTRSPR
jgi:Tol biopolymer transport system component